MKALALIILLSGCSVMPMPQAVRDFFEKPVPGFYPWPDDPRPYATPCCTLPPPRLEPPAHDVVPEHAGVIS